MSAADTGIVLDSFTFRSESEMYLARYDRAETPASMAVVTVLSKVLGRSPVDMEQLYYAVDADALDELLRGEDTADAVSVTFRYEDHEITVTADEVAAVPLLVDERNDARTGESVSA